MGITGELAGFVSQADYGALPEVAVREAKRILLETIAVALFGSSTELGRNLGRVLGQIKEPPLAMRIGIGDKCTITTGSFYNTAIADYNDSAGGLYKGVVHYGKNVVPAAFTVASAREQSGRDLLLAIMMGIECYSRIDLVICGPHIARGHYNDGTVGTIGCAIAVGKLLGLDKETLQGAIGNAGLLAPCTIGGNSMFRSVARPLALGQAAASGVLAAMMAEGGILGPFDVLECPGGFCDALSGVTDLSRVTQDLGKVWDSLVCYKKPFVGCRLTHSSRQGAQVLKKEHNIKAADIEKVTARLPLGVLLVTSHHAGVGGNLVEHSCSGPYLLANVLMYGDTSPNILSKERMNDTKVHELAERIELVEDPELTKISERGFEFIYRVNLEIAMKGGEKYSYYTEYVKGDPFDGWVMTDTELEEKFRTFTSGILNQSKQDSILRIVSELEELGNAAELMALLA